MRIKNFQKYNEDLQQSTKKVPHLSLGDDSLTIGSYIEFLKGSSLFYRLMHKKSVEGKPGPIFNKGDIYQLSDIDPVDPEKNIINLKFIFIDRRGNIDNTKKLYITNNDIVNLYKDEYFEVYED